MSKVNGVIDIREKQKVENVFNTQFHIHVISVFFHFILVLFFRNSTTFYAYCVLGYLFTTLYELSIRILKCSNSVVILVFDDNPVFNPMATVIYIHSNIWLHQLLLELHDFSSIGIQKK